jgi:CheY-like chemotaxis protein
MIVVLIVGILVTASLVAGAILGFPLPENVAFYSLAALTLLLTISVTVSSRRKGKLRDEKTEKDDTIKERDEIAEKLKETEQKLTDIKKKHNLDSETAVKFITLVSMLFRVSPPDAAALLSRTVRFFSAPPETPAAENVVFSSEAFITDALTPALSETAAAHIKISVNIPDSFPAKLSGSLAAARNIITETVFAALSLPPRELLIDIDFTAKGDFYDIRFIIEAVSVNLSKAEIDILTGAVSRGGAGAALFEAKARANTLGGSLEIKPRGSDTLFTVTLPLKNSGGGIIGSKAARDIASLRFLHCDFEFIPYGRVLIIDKNPRSRFAFSDLLLLHGLKTYTAADTESAVKLIRAGENFGIIFLDFDTSESTKFLRENGFDGTVIAVSAEELGADKLEAGEFAGQIRKPPELRVIESVLGQFIISRQPPAVIAAAGYSRKKAAKPLLPEPIKPQPEPTFEETLTAIDNLTVGADVHSRPQFAQTSPETPTPQTVPQFVETPPVSEPQITTPEHITKAQFAALSDEIFIKLYETMDTDLKAFAEHAKTIKNACADIGNSDLTAKARSLEFAAKDGKTAFIAEFTPEFLSALKSFADSLLENKAADPYISNAVKTLAQPQGILNGAPIAQKPAPEPQPEPQPMPVPVPVPEAAQPAPSKPTARGLTETIISACREFDSARAKEAVNAINTDEINAMAYGLVEEIKSLIAIGELAEAVEMAENLLDDLQ